MSDAALFPLSAWHVLEQQRVFRLLMQAFAYPGRIVPLSTQDDALVRCLATLVDRETTLADPHDLLSREQWPLLEARCAEADQADFVLAPGNQAPDFIPQRGSLESPEHGTTVIVRVDMLNDGQARGHTRDPRLRLYGPGIAGQIPLQVEGWHADWLQARTIWNADFPMGVDMLLIDRRSAVALPRTTRILTMESY